MSHVRQISDLSRYHIPMRGSAMLHENVAWYATEDDAVLGVVVRDKIDNDYGWVILTENYQGPGYTAVDIAHSLPTRGKATRALLAAMGEL